MPKRASSTAPTTATTAHDAERALGRADDALERERKRDPARTAASRASMRGPAPQHRIAERRRDAHPCDQPTCSPQTRSADVPALYGPEKNSEHRAPVRRRARKRRARAASKRQPARPHEPVADASERAAERRRKRSIRAGRLAIELGARERADRDAGEIRMRVEIRGLSRDGGCARFGVRQRVAAAGSMQNPMPLPSSVS